MENVSNGQGNSQIWSEYHNLPKSLSNSPEKFAEFYQRASHNADRKLDHKLFQGELSRIDSLLAMRSTAFYVVCCLKFLKSLPLKVVNLV